MVGYLHVRTQARSVRYLLNRDEIGTEARLGSCPSSKTYCRLVKYCRAQRNSSWVAGSNRSEKPPDTAVYDFSQISRELSLSLVAIKREERKRRLWRSASTACFLEGLRLMQRPQRLVAKHSSTGRQSTCCRESPRVLHQGLAYCSLRSPTQHIVDKGLGESQDNKWLECRVPNFGPVREYFNHFASSSSTSFFSTTVHHTIYGIPSFELDSSIL